jgi:hypothetical protein
MILQQLHQLVESIARAIKTEAMENRACSYRFLPVLIVMAFLRKITG